MPDPTPDPITNQDLYGGTPAPMPPPLPIEETPEIPVETPPTQIPPPAPMPKVSHGSHVIAIIVLVILVAAGVLFFGRIQTVIRGLSQTATQVSTPPADVTTPTPTSDPFAGWKPFTMVGISYELPPTVLSPTCDTSGCVSQGTYLPGGTRLTIAPKTVTQSLSSLHGAAITDAAGTAFTSTDATVSGHVAIEYTGMFSGTTSGGYGFTQMHGFMIEVTPTETLEINHFTPTGVTADWISDDTLFTQILSKLDFSGTPVATTSGS